MAAAVEAAPIYTQQVNFSDHGAFFADAPTYTVFDDFTLGENSAVNSLKIWGTYWDIAGYSHGQIPTPAQFRVSFHTTENSWNSPIYSNVVTASSLIDTGFDHNNVPVANILEITLNLSANIPLSSGVTYWLGIQAMNTVANDFAWQNSFARNNVYYQNDQRLSGDADLAFQLNAVPEPSTYAMVLAGIACAAWGTFRRRGIPHLRAATTIAFAAVVVLGAAVGQAATIPTLFLTNVDTVTNKSQILRFDATTGASLGNFLVGYDGAFIGGYTFGPDGNLYVSDFNGFTIDRYSGTTGAFLDTFATVTSSAPYQPLFGPDGNLYLGQSTGRITKYDGTTGQSLGVFVAPPTGVFDFGGMAFRGGSLYVSYIGSSGSLYRYDAATGGNRQQVYSGFSSNGPRAPVFDNGGTMYVPDWQTNKIYKFDDTSLALTGTITTAAGISPMSLAFDPTGALLVLSDNGVRSQINRYDRTTGAFLDTLVAPGTGGLGRAGDMILMVPEPSACVLGAAGLVCVGWAAWRRRRGMAAIREKTLS